MKVNSILSQSIDLFNGQIKYYLKSDGYLDYILLFETFQKISLLKKNEYFHRFIFCSYRKKSSKIQK